MKKNIFFTLILFSFSNFSYGQLKIDSTSKSQIINIELGINGRNYGKSFLQSENRKSIYNSKSSRVIGVKVGINFCLSESFDRPKIWLLKYEYNLMDFATKGTLVYLADEFLIPYTERYNILAKGRMSQNSIGIYRRRQTKPNWQFQYGVSFGLQNLKFFEYSLVDLYANENQPREIINLADVAIDNSLTKLELRVSFSFIRSFNSANKLEFGLDFVPTKQNNQFIKVNSSLEGSGFFIPSKTYLGLYASWHMFRKNKKAKKKSN